MERNERSRIRGLSALAIGGVILSSSCIITAPIMYLTERIQEYFRVQPNQEQSESAPQQSSNYNKNMSPIIL